MNVTVITTTVEPTNSWRVDHDTLVNSILTSFKKLVIFLNTFIETHHWPKVLSTGSTTQTGAAGVEPAVTVLETVGLPLTDAPIICTVV